MTFVSFHYCVAADDTGFHAFYHREVIVNLIVQA